MILIIFLGVAIIYNVFFRYRRERYEIIQSLLKARNVEERNMVLDYLFLTFFSECIIGTLVGKHFTKEGFFQDHLSLLYFFIGIYIFCFSTFQVFLYYLRKKTKINVSRDFNKSTLLNIRVTAAILLTPILLYSLFNGIFYEEKDAWGNWWILGLPVQIIFLSVTTIVFTAIIMLRLIPNREIVEDEYVQIIKSRLSQVGMPYLRLRWIETGIMNAFVVGIKLWRFSNQTMFIGKGLREKLTLEEFDAVVCHEIAHIVNKHIQRRVLNVVKLVYYIMLGIFAVFTLHLAASMIWNLVFYDPFAPTPTWVSIFVWIIMAFILSWIFFSYSIFFKSIRMHEFEADGYAVINLGVDPEILRNALLKLTTKSEMPDYLVGKINRESPRPGSLKQKMIKFFATHPSLEERFKMVKIKKAFKKSYNWYPFNSHLISAKKMGSLLQAKFMIPTVTVVVVLIFFGAVRLEKYNQAYKRLDDMTSSQIVADKEVIGFLTGKGLSIEEQLFMRKIIAKKDATLVISLVFKGADPRKFLLRSIQWKEEIVFEQLAQKYLPTMPERDFMILLDEAVRLRRTKFYHHLESSDNYQHLPEQTRVKYASMMKTEAERLPASEK